MAEHNVETAQSRCPGCEHSCCPHPGLECGGYSDVVQACERDALRAELAEALAADLSERPQRCGHSSDPMCCPYENFPTLAAFFKSVETPAVPDDFDPWDDLSYPPEGSSEVGDRG